MEKEKLEVVPVVPAMMKLDVAVQAFDMQDISNRRFMYNPKTGILILGQQYGKIRGLPGSHAEDLAQAGIKNGFDDFCARLGGHWKKLSRRDHSFCPQCGRPKHFPVQPGV